MTVAVSAFESTQARRMDRAVRALRLSGRRLMEKRGEWSVRRDGRSKPVARLSPEDIALLLAEEMIVEAEGGGYILTAAAVEEVTAAEADSPAPKAGPWIYSTAGKPRARAGGSGFSGLAHRARMGEGPVSLRQAAAGLRFIADVEQAGRTPALTMNWEAGPVDRQRRAGRPGGRGSASLAAERRIARVATALGESAFALLWAGCIEQMRLAELEKRCGLGQRTGAQALAAALEKVAAVYDG